MNIDRVSFLPPSADRLAWHLRAALAIPVPSRVLSVRVNGELWDDWALLQGGHVVPTLAADGSHGVRRPAQYVSSASAGGEFLDGRGAPEVAAYVPWEGGAEYELSVEVAAPGQDAQQLTATVRAPAAGGFPFAGWPRHRVFHLRETAGLARAREPVEVLLSAYGHECASWEKELRVGVYDPHSGDTTSVPFEVVKETRANHTSTTRRELCTSAWVVVFVDAAAGADLLLTCAWGRADSEPADMTPFGPDLQVEGEAPKLTGVRNGHYAAELCPRSGQLAGLQALVPGTKGPGDEDTGARDFFYSPGKGENHFLHYNPDLWIPDSTWTHASDWNPAPYTTASAGPLVARARHWGHLPRLPGVHCSVEYTFYAWTPWIRTRTVLEVEAVLTTNGIRNEEIVINADQADRCAWKGLDGQVHDRAAVGDPALPSGIVAVVENEAPWVTLYDGASGAGIAGIRVNQQATTRGEGERAYWNTGTLIVDYGWGFKYWSRSLIYGTGDFWPDREYVVEPGPLYTDECAYMPVVVREEGAARFAALDAAEAQLRQPLRRVWTGSGPY